jgi:hypothetical protein
VIALALNRACPSSKHGSNDNTRRTQRCVQSPDSRYVNRPVGGAPQLEGSACSFLTDINGPGTSLCNGGRAVDGRC